jgi:hypothetical protein
MGSFVTLSTIDIQHNFVILSVVMLSVANT